MFNGRATEKSREMQHMGLYVTGWSGCSVVIRLDRIRNEYMRGSLRIMNKAGKIK